MTHPAPTSGSAAGRPLARLLTAALAVLALVPAAHAQSVSQLERQLAAAIQEGRASDAEKAVDAIHGVGSRAAADLLLKVGAVAEDALYRRIVLGLAGSEAKDVVEAVARRVGSGQDKERVVAAAVSANRTDERTFAALVESVGTPREPVRRMVLRALVARRDKRAVAPMIDQLVKTEAKTGGGAGLVRRALADLTGLDFPSAVEWLSYWESKGADFELPAPGEDGTSGAKVEARAGATAARFFGRTLDADRIVFVIDVSGSMTVSDRAAEGGRPQTGGDGQPHVTDSRVRLERAKVELMNVLEALPSSASFTIIAYSGFAPTGYRRDGDPDETSWLQVFSPKLQKVSATTVKKAVDFTKALAATGSTFTGRAIETALEVPDVELVILLSDGAPTEWVDDNGRWRTLTPDDVRANIRTANRFKRATIDTFGFEGQPDGRGRADPADFVEFMKAIARDNGGTYQPID